MNAVIEYVPVREGAAATGRPDQVRPSQFYNAGAYLKYALMAVAFVLAYVALPWDLHWGFLAVPLGLVASRAGYCWVDFMCLSYRFDDRERIVWSWGVLARSTGSLEVFRVQNVTLHQSFFERLAGVGTVVLETRDETNPVLRLVGMKNPEELRASLTDYVQRVRRARGVAEASVN